MGLNDSDLNNIGSHPAPSPFTYGPVNVFRSISVNGIAVGDVAITAAGAGYEWTGTAWSALAIGGGGGSPQTPWASAINGGAFALTNVSSITATTFIGALTGNASTATALATSRSINGVAFNGTADITVTAAAGTLTGAALNATVTTSSLTTLGTLAANLIFTDNTYDIGATGATRPRTGYFATSMRIGANAPGDTTSTLSATSAAASTAIRLGMFEASAVTSRAEFTVANSGTSASWTNNFFSIMVHGASYVGDNYLSDSTSDAGNVILLTQGSAVTMLAIGCYNATPINFFTNNTRRWQVSAAGMLLCPTDNTLDIGATGATRPRSGFFGTSITVGTSFIVGANQVVAARRTGWTAWTGNATRTTFATSTATLVNVAEAVKALVDDLIAHGLIGT